MSHSFGEYVFEFWDGPAPALATRKLVVSHLPGVSGVAHQVLGTWGETFSVVLTSHHVSWENAVAIYNKMQADLIGTGPKFLMYEGWLWSGFTGTYYNIEAIDLVDMRAAIILIGPTYSYYGGVSLVTRFTLTPQAI